MIAAGFSTVFQARQKDIIKHIVQDILMFNPDYTIEHDITENWVEFEDLSSQAKSKIIVLRILSNHLLTAPLSPDLAMPIFKLFRKILASEGRLSSSEYLYIFRLTLSLKVLL